MDASFGEDRRSAAEPGSIALFRMRTAIADAIFVAEGVALGLLLKWAERAPPFDDLPPRVRGRRDPGDGAGMSADRWPHA